MAPLSSRLEKTAPTLALSKVPWHFGANSPYSYNFVSGGAVVGYGMRNEVGMAFDGNNMYVAPLPISQWLHDQRECRPSSGDAQKADLGCISQSCEVDTDKLTGFGELRTAAITSHDRGRTSISTTRPRN